MEDGYGDHSALLTLAEFRQDFNVLIHVSHENGQIRFADAQLRDSHIGRDGITGKNAQATSMSPIGPASRKNEAITLNYAFCNTYTNHASTSTI